MRKPVPSLKLLDGQGQIRPLSDVEAETLRFAIKHHGGCMVKAARSLGIGRSTLYRRAAELGLSRQSA